MKLLFLQVKDCLGITEEDFREADSFLTEEKIQFILEKTDVILKRLLIRGKNKNPLPPELDVAFHDLLIHDCSRLEQQRESAVDVLDRWGREDIRVNSHQSLSACDEETKARGKNAEAEASR